MGRLHGVVVGESDTIFNTKYFIISSKITALCNRNRSAVLACIYIHTYIHISSCRRESDDDSHRHTYTHPCPPLILRVHKRTHTFGARLYSTSRSASITHAHTQVAVYWRFGWWWHIHTHAHAWLLAQTHISPSRLQERFPCTNAALVALHATCVLVSLVCATSLLSRHGHIADCTVRHPGVERPFSNN